MPLKPPVVATAAFQEPTWKPLFPQSSCLFMNQQIQKTDESFLFALVDLLETRALAKYESEIQSGYDQACDPKPEATFDID